MIFHGIQRRGRNGFPLESVQHMVLRGYSFQLLSDKSTQPKILGLVYNADAAFAKLFQNPVNAKSREKHGLHGREHKVFPQTTKGFCRIYMTRRWIYKEY
jgi:hypothetical protein